MQSEVSTSHSFSPIACLNCRKAHRKCDRQLPQCSECTCRNLTNSCTYALPKKRGPKQTSSPTDEVQTSKPKKTTPSTNSLKRKYLYEEEFHTDDYGNNDHSSTNSNRFTFHGQQKHVTSAQAINNSPSLPTTQTNGTMNHASHLPIYSTFNGQKQLSQKEVSQQMVSTHITPTTKQNSVVIRQNDTIIPMEQLESVEQIQYRGHGKQFLDFYYSVMSSGFPCFPRVSFDTLLDTIFCYTHPQVNTVTQLSPVNERLLCLLESVEIVVLQRIGRKKVAEELFQITRRRLCHYFDECIDSFELSLTMLFLCDYLYGAGNYKQSAAYFALSKVYFEENANLQDPHQRVSLHFIKMLDVQMCKDIVGQIRGLGNLIMSWNTGKDKFFDVEALDSKRYDSDMEYLKAILSFIDSMEQQTKKFYYENNIVQQQASVLETSEHIYKLSSQMSLMDLTYGIVMVGLRLKILTQVGMWNTALVRQCADKVSHMAQSPWFDSCQHITVEPVVLAATVHLNDPNTKLWFLTTDLRALRSLDQRFDVITRKHSDLVNSIREKLAKLQQQNDPLMMNLIIDKNDEVIRPFPGIISNKYDFETNGMVQRVLQPTQELISNSYQGMQSNPSLTEFFSRQNSSSKYF